MTFPHCFVDVLNLAVKAGRLILDVYEHQKTEVTLKADDSPLTQADILSHQFLLKELELLGKPVISEEGDGHLWEKRLLWPQYWLIDPLDGTKEFVKRNGEFTVNIALIKDQQPIWGVIYAPVLKTLYGGVVGEGAWIWQIPQSYSESEDWYAIQAQSLPLVRQNPLLTVVGSKSHLSGATLSFMEKLRRVDPNHKLIQAGSSLKFCRIATGEADIYPRMDSIMEWDIAAGQAIVRAAGGTMIRWPEQTVPQYTSRDMRSPKFLAIAPGRDVDGILETLK